MSDGQDTDGWHCLDCGGRTVVGWADGTRVFRRGHRWVTEETNETEHPEPVEEVDFSADAIQHVDYLLWSHGVGDAVRARVKAEMRDERPPDWAVDPDLVTDGGTDEGPAPRDGSKLAVDDRQFCKNCGREIEGDADELRWDHVNNEWVEIDQCAPCEAEDLLHNLAHIYETDVAFQATVRGTVVETEVIDTRRDTNTTTCEVCGDETGDPTLSSDSHPEGPNLVICRRCEA